MERKKGSFILNNSRKEFTGRIQAIHVVSDTTFSKLIDSKRQSIQHYISDGTKSIPAGTIIAARDGSVLTNIAISDGAIELIF